MVEVGLGTGRFEIVGPVNRRHMCILQTKSVEGQPGLLYTRAGPPQPGGHQRVVHGPDQDKEPAGHQTAHAKVHMQRLDQRQ